MDKNFNFLSLWKIQKRRLQLISLGLEDYYNEYVDRLYQGYINAFSVVHILVNLLHIFLLVIFVQNRNLVIWDIALYTLSLVLVFIPLYLIFQKNIKDNYFTVFMASFLPLFTLGLADLIVLIHAKATAVRPCNADYIINSVYIFMPIFEISHCIYLGLVVSIFYFLCFIFAYVGDEFAISKVTTEIVVLVTMNLFGFFFRIMRDIAIIEIFFDRWELIKQTVMFKYESDQERNLLLSIIPANTANDLVSDIMHRIKTARNSSDADLRMQNFKLKPDKLYVYFYTGVSILYADVVNYTYLTTTLEVKPLVETLHELFVKFDEAAVKYNCLRIKFLGDCYYCVSGIPEKNQYHAKSCVELGLKMIRIIRETRARLNLDIDMRIGVHSGNVFAGIIGSAKWQYDIWSRDVEIANTLESTGVAGVHVSKYTLSNLNDQFPYEEGPEQARNNEYLIKNGITETFLIIPKLEENEMNSSDVDISSVEIIRHKSTSFLTMLIDQYKKIQEDAREEMSKQFANMPAPTSIVHYMHRMIGKTNKSKERVMQVTPIFLFMKDEMLFWRQADELLKYSCLTATCTFFGIILLGTFMHSFTATLTIELLFVIFILLFWLTILWYQTLWNKIWIDTTIDNDEDYLEPQRNIISDFIYNLKITQSPFWKIVIYVSVVMAILFSSLTGLIECGVYENTHNNQTKLVVEEKYRICLNTWSVTEAVVVTRCIHFLFLQIPYICKVTVGLTHTIIYTVIIFSQFPYVYEFSDTINVGLDPKIAHLYVVVISFILLTLIERQTEIFFKTHFKWKKKLHKRIADTEISKQTAKMLIENILPAHVAEIYMGKKMKNELYTEKYENVAIMFATIRNYDIGMVGLRVLNKILCDFDDKLSMYSGPLRIEKIKVVGLTYMAACGLDPGYCDDTSLSSKTHKHIRQRMVSRWVKVRQLVRKQELRDIASPPFLNVFIMTQFALELMKTLHKFNIEYFNTEDQSETKVGVLRIGISHGEVMGGVVGLSKPFYDVWGNTINMASRMDTTGEDGKIQVTEETAIVLKSFNIQCDYRGLTFVKGIEYIPTYFVGINEKLEFIQPPRVSVSDIREKI